MSVVSSKDREVRRLRRALVLLDGSTASECALSRAISLSKSEGTEVILGHIIIEPRLPIAEPLASKDAELVERLAQRARDLARTYLAGVERSLRSRGVPVRVRLQSADDIREGVLSLAAEEDVDVAILTSHGQTSSRRVILGGVAEQVLLHASTPVWIVQLLHNQRKLDTGPIVALDPWRSQPIQP